MMFTRQLQAMRFDRIVGKRPNVALFLVVVLTLLGSVHTLKCYCAEYIDGLQIPWDICDSGDSCETSTGVCYYNLRCNDGTFLIQTYNCIEDIHDVSSISITCKLPPPDTQQVVGCCDGPDFCNRDLNLTLPSESSTEMPPTQSPTATITPTSSDDSQDDSQDQSVKIIVAIAVPLFVTVFFVTLLVLVIVLNYLRRRKLRTECTRRVPGGMREACPTGKMELMEMTVTSGSGSGLPFLIQRTVARTIKVTDLIGNGRYGQVYLGYYQGEPVAVKKFFSRDEKSWCRETEIYNTLLLRHDNILGFFASDMVSNNGVTELWLITQYHQFGSLYDFLVQEAVSPKVMLQMAISTCAGLAHIHTELYGTQAKPAIAHRDIKTKNVLVKNNMTCCIADFGLAVFKNQNEMNVPTNPKQGTKRYMAPEILNETINMKSFESFKKVDVYALGLVLWELCRRCTGTTGVPEEYEVPLQGMVPPDPSFEDMRRVVVMERRQPAIPPRWNTEELLREITKVMRECWYYTSTARPTAVYLKKKLLKMGQELEKMNYGDLDVQQAI